MFHTLFKRDHVKSVTFLAFLAFSLFFSGGNSIANVITPEKHPGIYAIQLAKKKQYAQASVYSARVNDPVVDKLVDWYLFRSEDYQPSFVSVAGFLHNNPTWPRAQGLKIKAEKIFPNSYPNKYIEQWFDRYAPVSKEGLIRYVDALIKLGKRDKARLALDAWFQDSVLKPDEQRQILNKYGSLIARSTLLGRFENALLGGYYSNALVLASRLGHDYVKLADARIALSQGQQGVDAKIKAVPAHLRNDVGLVYERVKWRRKAGNIDGAADLLRKIRTIPHESLQHVLWKQRHILVREYIEQKQYGKAYALAASHMQTKGFPHAQAQFISGWLALRFVGKPMRAFHHFEALYKNVKTPISKSRGAYWAARASEALKDMKTAEAWYGEAARYPTVFYGQKALDRLNKTPNYKGKPETAPTGSAFNNNTKVRAILALYRADVKDDIEDFLISLTKDAEKGLVRFSDLASLAIKVGYPHQAVRIAKKAENKGHLLLGYAFPQATYYTDKVPFQDKALIHGLIRQESGFYTNAKSRSGALGLMQLMPATAKETAGKIGVKHRKSWLTQKPAHNIALGSAYIDQLIGRFDGSYPLAIAGYNGGPGRVGGWLKTYGDPSKKSEHDIIDWIEMIPVYETRNYVQRVSESMRVYSYIFANPRKSSILSQR